MVRVFPEVPRRSVQYNYWRNVTPDDGDLRSMQRYQVVGGVGDGGSNDDTTAAAAVGYVSCRVPHTRTPGVFYGSNPLEDSFSALLLDIVFVILIIHILHLFLRPLHQPKIVSQILVRSIILFPLFFNSYIFFFFFLIILYLFD